MAERGIHDISPFRITKYRSHNRLTLTSVTTVTAELTKPKSMGFKPTFIRINPTNGTVLLEFADSQTTPSNPNAGSYRITSGNPEWVQIPIAGRVKIRALTGTVLTEITWAA